MQGEDQILTKLLLIFCVSQISFASITAILFCV